MDVAILALRLVHVGSAIVWGGSAVLAFAFIGPAGRDLGPAARPFLHRLEAGLGPFFPAASTLTVLAGSVLYWIDSNGDPIRFLTGGGMGTGLGVGALAAWGAWALGALVIGPAAGRLARVDARIAEAGDPIPAELVAARAAVIGRDRTASTAEFACLVVAIVCMATARYWP